MLPASATPKPSPSAQPGLPSGMGDSAGPSGNTTGGLDMSSQALAANAPTNTWGAYWPSPSAHPMTPASDGTIGKDDLMSWFYNQWSNDSFRIPFVMYANALGVHGNNIQNYWHLMERAGTASSMLYNSGDRTKLTPLQLIQMWANNPSGGSRLPGMRGGGGGTAGGPITTTSTSYNVLDPGQAKTITENVMAAMLGREPTPTELQQYRDAMNANSAAHPNVTTTTTNGHSSHSVSSGGGQDPQSFLQDKVKNTTQGQAFSMNNLFESAMSHLAQRIG